MVESDPASIAIKDAIQDTFGDTASFTGVPGGRASSLFGESSKASVGGFGTPSAIGGFGTPVGGFGTPSAIKGEEFFETKASQ